MAVALVATVRATVVEIPAATTGYAWWNRDYQGYETSGKIYGNLALADVGSHFQDFRYRPFLKFALDTLPDSCLALSADLNYYQYGHSWSLPTTVVKLIPDPVPNGQDIIWQIAHGPELSSQEPSPDSWQRRPFNDFALRALDSCRAVGWMSFGIECVHYSGPYECEAWGDSGTFPPYLRVEYTVSGVNDDRGLRMSPLLTITPNPTSGRFVTIQLCIPCGSGSSLTLRNVPGGTIRSYSLDPSGRTQLDLRGLAPGVYLATLDGTMPLVSRKLVITAR